MADERIDNKTLRQQVYDRMYKKITSGDHLPGESFTIRSIAQQYGVSLIPVREALWQLESEHIIVIESNKNVKVNSLTHEEMQEIRTLRLNIECFTAETACRERPDGKYLELKKVLESMADSVDKPKKYTVFNRQFHFEIYSYSNLPLHLRFIKHMWARLSPYLIIHTTRMNSLASTFTCHQEMFDSFVNGEPEKLVSALKEDIENSISFLLKVVD